MFTAILLCSALLPSETDGLTVRVVNTLDEQISVRFRVVGKEEWVKPDLSLQGAQTKSISLPKGDKYEVVIRDTHDKDSPVGSWDFGKMIAKDAKAEIHIVDASQSPAKPHADTSGKPKGLVGKLFSKAKAEFVPNIPVAAAPVTAVKTGFELTVFSQKEYFLINEFIGGKTEDQPKADQLKPGQPAIAPPRTEVPIIDPGPPGAPIPIRPLR